MSKSAADRVSDHLGPKLALQPRRRFRKDAVLIHKQVRARVEHVFACMKTWRILCDCRLRRDGVHHPMRGIGRLHNLTYSRAG